ncbi:hypothetical protein BDY19DRAFT_902196 [Irpex rosettiformis]|uniref:Uncharacterized protein n=1 Tax=Irpex rosettiformis TaxID=378272 RepID=A0ACB8UP40_9APHY|nr:hypothetical protein BDY19DRAFT_902196 [Irpex rosettiformis]
MHIREVVLSVVLCVTSTTLILTTAWVLSDVYINHNALQTTNVHINAAHESSFIGEDFPFLLSLDDLPPSRQNLSLVRMTFEETVHYGFDAEISLNEWYQMLPLGSVAIRQGPHQKLFAVSMFHELHCHRLLHEAFVKREKHALKHVAHCMNYLRQLFLCRADLTPEPGNILTLNFTEYRQGPTRVCRDWEAVYDNMGYSWLKWLKIKGTNNL